MTLRASLPLVAIVGRPNVGKSTLFNRLIRRRKAIVQDTAGVTRDRHYGEVSWEGKAFRVVDTGGLDPTAEDEMARGVQVQAQLALEEADLVLFVLDGRAGLTPADAEVASVLRKGGWPVLAAVNKADGARQANLVHDFHSLGMTPLLAVSAEHGRGVTQLVEEILRRLGDDLTRQRLPEEEEGPIRVAVLGRPNAGKSTLVNMLCGEERVVVSEQAGTTRDSVDTHIRSGDRDYLLIDTAGMRRRAKVKKGLEELSVEHAIQAIDRAQVVLLIIDAMGGLGDQDCRLAQLVMDRGRSLIVLLNKWDLVSADPEGRRSEVVREEVGRRLSFSSFAPVLTLAAETGLRCGRILQMVDRLARNRQVRIPTPVLNRHLADWYQAHHPATYRGRTLRFYYAAQVDVEPPTFLFSVSAPKGVRVSYKRYLLNKIRGLADFEGSPLKLRFKAHREAKQAGKRGRRQGGGRRKGRGGKR